jgi:hypothetical protein
MDLLDDDIMDGAESCYDHCLLSDSDILSQCSLRESSAASDVAPMDMDMDMDPEDEGASILEEDLLRNPSGGGSLSPRERSRSARSRRAQPGSGRRNIA